MVSAEGSFHLKVEVVPLKVEEPTILDHILDFLLVAVKPEYQSKGAFAMVFNDLLGNYLQMDLVDVESNPELETNTKVQSQWNDFEKEQHKRRRAFKKELC